MVGDHNRITKLHNFFIGKKIIFFFNECLDTLMTNNAL